MRARAAAGAMLLAALCAPPAPARAAYEELVQDDSLMTRVGDWFSDLGRSESEKRTMRNRRRAERLIRTAEHAAQDRAKQVEAMRQRYLESLRRRQASS